MADFNELDNLKAGCIAALRRQDEDAFEEAAVKLQQAQAPIAAKLEACGLLGCLALKQKCRRSALKALNVLAACAVDIAEGEAEDEQAFLQNLHHIAVMAARTHDRQLFNAAVSRLAVRYAKSSYVAANAPAFVNLLTELLFTAADRRYVQALPMLEWLALRLCRTEAVSTEILQPFLREWACLAAQAARRDWQDVAELLLNGLFRMLLRQHDFALTRSLLLYIALHMQMYAAWDGVEKAFGVYAPLHKFSLLLLERAVRNPDEANRTAQARMLLRLWRDFIAAAARQTMQDEMQVYQSWFNSAMAAPRAKMQTRSRRFIQLTLGYWSAQQPKTSRKQLAYLKNIFEPDLVTDKYLRLLEEAR